MCYVALRVMNVTFYAASYFLVRLAVVSGPGISVSDDSSAFSLLRTATIEIFELCSGDCQEYFTDIKCTDSSWLLIRS